MGAAAEVGAQEGPLLALSVLSRGLELGRGGPERGGGIPQHLVGMSAPGQAVPLAPGDEAPSRGPDPQGGPAPGALGTQALAPEAAGHARLGPAGADGDHARHGVGPVEGGAGAPGDLDAVDEVPGDGEAGEGGGAGDEVVEGHAVHQELHRAGFPLDEAAPQPDGGPEGAQLMGIHPGEPPEQLHEGQGAQAVEVVPGEDGGALGAVHQPLGVAGARLHGRLHEP